MGWEEEVMGRGKNGKGWDRKRQDQRWQLEEVRTGEKNEISIHLSSFGSCPSDLS